MASGMNYSLCASIFWMPLVDNVLGVATIFSWFVDIYVAEIFHKYKMSESLKPYAGVGVSWADKGKALQ